MPSVFRCPSGENARAGITNYVAIVGPNTPWLGSRTVSFADITDGTSNALLLVEATDSGICWIEPRDLPEDRAQLGINQKPGLGMSSVHERGMYVLFGDGSCRYIYEDIPPETLRCLIEISDGETIDEF